jgi:cytochrome oxidase assembly protein ShyY1
LGWRFAPRWYYLLLTAAAVALFASLGSWQWHRGQYRSSQWQAFSRTDTTAIQAGAASMESLPRYTRVEVTGEFDAQRQFLLDNISHQGAPGYEVLSLLKLVDGGNLLVNRGWVPFSGYRDQLPDVKLDAEGLQHVTGRLSVLPAAGMASGRQAPALSGDWPRVTSFPVMAELQTALGAKLLAPVLLMDAEAQPGYLRDWQPSGIPPERHYSYAVQWWAFALLALGLFTALNLKRRNV